jgi:tRNA pseudouridine55 synthase
VSAEHTEGHLLLVDKPLGWTSFDVVKKLRYALKVKKIGHSGTLDPLATGLLIIGTGKYTKQLHELQGLDKSYEGVMEIGKTTPSYDLETAFDSETPVDHIEMEDLLKAKNQLTGAIEQLPPAHSAVKVEGKRAYSLARKNIPVAMKSRQVTIHQFDVKMGTYGEVAFNVKCSKGTYIRSLVHDFGQYLGVGAYLKQLRRTGIGTYSIEDALTIDTVISRYLA